MTREDRNIQRAAIINKVAHTFELKRVNLIDLNKTPSHKKDSSTKFNQRTPRELIKVINPQQRQTQSDERCSSDEVLNDVDE